MKNSPTVKKGLFDKAYNALGHAYKGVKTRAKDATVKGYKALGHAYKDVKARAKDATVKGYHLAQVKVKQLEIMKADAQLIQAVIGKATGIDAAVLRSRNERVKYLDLLKRNPSGVSPQQLESYNENFNFENGRLEQLQSCMNMFNSPPVSAKAWSSPPKKSSSNSRKRALTELGIEGSTPSPTTLRKIYKRRALATHPDKNPGKGYSPFRRVKNAYEKLKTI
jgi:hypothetical protein